MNIKLKKFNIETKFNDVVKLTDDIKAFVESTGVKEGQCIIFNPHTTAGLIPTRIDFKHQHDTPTDAAGHVKSTLIGVDLPLIIHDGKLLLGSSQGIYFLEFDGPRKRSFYVQVMGE